MPAMPMNDDERELMLHIDNTRALYYARNNVCAMIAKHHAKGRFDLDKAALAFESLTNEGAKSYHREFCLRDSSPAWNVMFPVDVRRNLAKHYAEWFKSCVDQACLGDLGESAAIILRKGTKV